MENNAVIYARYSSSSQDEQTIEMQINKCRDFANKNDLIVVDEYTDEAKSGRTGKRTGLQQILTDSKKGTFKYVIMYMSDRYFRNTREALDYEDKLNNNGVELLYTMEQYDNTPQGKYMKLINYANNQLYSDMYAVRIANGIENNANKFLSIGNGSIPFGYKSVEKRILLDDENAPYVKMIFEMYANGSTMADIIRHLNSLGVKTQRKQDFNKSSIKRILKNRRYLGIYIYKGKETPDKIPRIIDDDLFNKVQLLLNKNQKAPGRRKAKEEYLLTTKLFCGECKEMMVGVSGTSKTKDLHYYYSCKNTKRKLCNKKNVRKEYLEEKVFDTIYKTLTKENIHQIAVNVVKITEENQDLDNLSLLNKNQKKLEKEKDNLINAVAECDISSIRKSLYEKIEQTDVKLKDIARQIYEEEKNKLKLSVTKVEFFLSRLKNVSSSNIQSKRTLIDVLVNKIYLYSDKMIIILNTQEKELEVDIDTLNTQKSSSVGSFSPPIDNSSPYFRDFFLFKILKHTLKHTFLYH